jgi:hypothetical protein
VAAIPVIGINIVSTSTSQNRIFIVFLSCLNVSNFINLPSVGVVDHVT